MADQREGRGQKARSDVQKTAEAWRKSQPYLDAVYQLLGSVAAGGVVGWVLDRWLHRQPWFLVGGLVFGIVAGMVEFIRRVTKLK